MNEYGKIIEMTNLIEEKRKQGKLKSITIAMKNAYGESIMKYLQFDVYSNSNCEMLKWYMGNGEETKTKYFKSVIGMVKDVFKEMSDESYELSNVAIYYYGIYMPDDCFEKEYIFYN